MKETSRRGIDDSDEQNTNHQKKDENREDYYERYEHGPITMERFGNIIRISSNWDPKDYEKFLDYIKSNRPNYEKDIDKEVSDLKNIFKKYNPLDLLSPLATYSIVLGPKFQGEFAVQRRRPDRPVNANLIMNIQGFEFNDYGEYKIAASIGDDLRKSLSFYIEKPPDTPHQEVEIR